MWKGMGESVVEMRHSVEVLTTQKNAFYYN